MSSFVRFASLLFLLASANHAFSDELLPITLPNSEIIPIHANSNNKDYELLIQLPASYKDTTKNYPVVIVTDTRFAFPLASGTLQLMGDRVIQEAILVGLSYSKGDDFTISRTRDYTPTYSPKEKSGHSDAAREVSGHAKEYVQFIAEQVIPTLKKNYRIDENKKIFVGHSFGGLLGSYILTQQPNLFDHYIIGSPSLWYDKKVILKLEKDYASKHNNATANVMIFVDADHTGMNTAVADVREFEQALRSHHYAGLKLYVEVLKNESHHSVFPALLSKGLMSAIPLKK